MFCAFLFGFLPTVLREDVTYVVAVMAAYCLAIEMVQLVLLYAIGRLLPRSALALPTALALTTLINAILMYYGYSPFFLGSTSTFRLAGTVIGFGILFFIFFGATRARNQRILGFGLAAAVFLSALAPSLSKQPSVPTTQSAKLEKWKHINLKQKPNIHLISFDSMMPAALAKKFLNVDPLPYQQALERSDATILKNAFTTRQGSWLSLNSVLKLDDQADFPDNVEYLNGEAASPLLELFRANGYKTATGYAGDYFGKQGPYLDRYDYLPGLSASRMSLCRFQARLAFNLQIGHFGFCEALRELEKWTGASKAEVKREWPKKVAHLIRDEPKSTPWLTLHYIYNPIGHTEGNHITGDASWTASYRKHFLDASEQASAIAVKMVDQIRKDDPNAVIFVFGDHGVWLSRTITYNVDPTFVVQDRYGVFAALPKTNNACSTPDLTRYNPDFVTLSRVVASIIRCLAADPMEVDRAVNFMQDYDLKQYLYENAS
jgi:hypothetical protein